MQSSYTVFYKVCGRNALEWESFRDQFQGILDKTPNLSNVYKLLLLQQYLKGDAGEMLKNTPIKEVSFEGAC